MDTSNKALRWPATALRVALGAIFVYAAYVKLKEPWALFAMAIDSYQLLPTWAVEALAKTLPWCELALGVALISGLLRRTSTTITSALLLVFLSLIVRAAIKGQQISCGCFSSNETISWKTILRDGSMLAGSLFVTAMAWLSPRRARRSEPASLLPPHTQPEPAGNLPTSTSL